jgi:hypothetical protein
MQRAESECDPVPFDAEAGGSPGQANAAIHGLAYPVDVPGIEHHDGVDGRDEMLADQVGHGNLDYGEAGEGGGHGEYGATDQRPGGNAKDEGEGGVGDRGDAAGVEQYRPERGSGLQR